MLDDMLALCTWPLQSVRFGADLVETWMAAGEVVAARLPILAAAAIAPASADHAELGRMVSEKADAFGRSGQAVSAAGARVRSTSQANARALGRLAGGGMLWPGDWLKLCEDNLATAAALATLPARSLKPIHGKVAANSRRLSARR